MKLFLSEIFGAYNSNLQVQQKISSIDISVTARDFSTWRFGFDPKAGFSHRGLFLFSPY
jgi:hypothetical protein